ncbi:MAG: VWA domain-containing protein [Gemmatimonadota bacterium]
MTDIAPLTLTARFDRDTIGRSRPSPRHLVIQVQAPDVTAPARDAVPPLNLALVIDASGSMSADDGAAGPNGVPLTRLAAARQAAAGIARCLRERDALSVVSFADDTQTHVEARSMDAAGQREACAAIAAIDPRGSTNLHDGWLRGAELAASHMEKDGTCQNRVLVLSDGHANQGVTDPGALAEIAAGLRQRGLFTSCVGIGLDYSTDQLEQMAEHGGGLLHHAERPAEIIEIVLAELRQMRAIVADDVSVEVDLPPGQLPDGRGYPLRVQVLGLTADIEDNTLRAPLGALTSGASRHLVLQLRTRRHCDRDTLHLPVRLSWRDRDGQRHTAAAGTRLTRVSPDQARATPFDTGIGELAARAWLATIVRTAVDLNRGGDGRRAQTWVRAQEKEFGAYCRHLPAGDEHLRRLRHLTAAIVRPPHERSRRGISMFHYRSLKGTQDLRAAAPADWEGSLESERPA